MLIRFAYGFEPVGECAAAETRFALSPGELDEVASSRILLNEATRRATSLATDPAAPRIKLITFGSEVKPRSTHPARDGHPRY